MAEARQHERGDAAGGVNARVAAALAEVARLLEAQGANEFRVRAYRGAARTVRELRRPLPEILDTGGPEALETLRGIGPSLARSIDQLAHSGRLALLERLRGDVAPPRLLTTVAGIGPELAHRIHERLGIETLAELHAAAHDGRLARVPGVGPRRLRAIRDVLAGRLRGVPAPPPAAPAPRPAAEAGPPIAELLDIDAEYRRKAADDALPRVAPRRFNPTGAAWLPILHTHRGGRHYTALYSNTAHAHAMGATHDWVVLYRDDHDARGQWTVVTAHLGRLRGRRIVRGREDECRDHYAESSAGTPTLF
ncbi:MAG: helix-hairpin-helix domain-containing protein [Planctomycetota bacterium]|jgi:predicted flap endonuclease-1-like 5' DNA nuclease